MIEVGILKNFDSGTYKAGVQLAGSLTTYFDDISVAKNILSSALVVGNYVILAIPGGNPKDACVIATWPGGTPGGGTLLDLSDTPSSYSGQAGKYPKVNAAENVLEFEAYPFAALFTPIAGGIFGQIGFTTEHPFTAKINAAGSGGLTATNVPYDGEANEGAVVGIYASAANWGRMMLYNSTRGTYRKIVTVNTTTNVITTDSSVDSWADNDDITTQSQTNTTAGYVDMDVSAEIPADATFLYLFAQYNDLAAAVYDGYRHLFFHPYEAYDAGLRYYLPACVAGDVAVLVFVQKIISQKFTMFARHPSTNMSIALLAKGYF